MPKMKPETFTLYDTSDYLKDDHAIVVYLEVAMEEASDDPDLLAVALSKIARARRQPQ